MTGQFVAKDQAGGYCNAVDPDMKSSLNRHGGTVGNTNKSSGSLYTPKLY